MSRVSDKWVAEHIEGKPLLLKGLRRITHELTLDLKEAREMHAQAFRLAVNHQERANAAEAEVARLTALINHPHTNSFLDAVRLEAAHQRERWAAEHDSGKTDADWLWLIGHLVGKAIHKPEKQLHHIVTSAAACLNWHMQRTVGNDMRPGIKEPA